MSHIRAGVAELDQSGLVGGRSLGGVFLGGGAAAKGPRMFDWAVASVAAGDDTPPGWGRWLLVRRQILAHDQIAADREPELAYYMCAGPPGTTDDDLIRVAGTRWAIEECFQTAKTEVGLDHYQVRRYDATSPKVW